MMAEPASQTQRISAAEFRAIQVELARASLIDFCRLVCPETFTFGVSQVTICDFIDRLITGEEFTKGQINLAPRAGKSEIASIALPAYLIGRFTDKRIIHLCNNLDLTRQFAERLVALLQSDVYREIFPHVEVMDISTNRVNFRTRGKPRSPWGRYFVTSIKKATSGHGANFLLVDDPLTEQEANSKQVKDGIFARWSTGFTTRVDPTWNRILLVGTRWARDDLFGRVIAQWYEDDKAEAYETLKVPVTVDAETAQRFNAIALRDPVFKVDLARKRVKLLTAGGTFAPERFSQEFVDKMRARLTPEQFALAVLADANAGPRHDLQQEHVRCVRQGHDARVEGQDCFLDHDVRPRHEDWRRATITSAFLHIGVVPEVTKRLGEEYIQNTIVHPRCVAGPHCSRRCRRHIKTRYKDWRPNRVIIEDAASGTWHSRPSSASTSRPMASIRENAQGQKRQRGTRQYRGANDRSDADLLR